MHGWLQLKQGWPYGPCLGSISQFKIYIRKPKWRQCLKGNGVKTMYLKILMLLFNGISYLIWSSLFLPLHDFLSEFIHEPYHCFIVTIDVTIWNFSFFICFIFRLSIWSFGSGSNHLSLFLLACMVFPLPVAMFI